MKFVQPATDPWHTPSAEDGSPVDRAPEPHRVLTIEQWHACRPSWPEGVPVGVMLPNDTDVETLVDDLPRLALVQLAFPKWVDGRAYSQAHLLRARYRFGGEVRATGDVLVDMLPLLQRTGVDAVVLRADQSIEAAQRALGFFPGHYQGDVDDPEPLFAKPEGTGTALARAQRASVQAGIRT